MVVSFAMARRLPTRHSFIAATRISPDTPYVELRAWECRNSEKQSQSLILSNHNRLLISFGLLVDYSFRCLVYSIRWRRTFHYVPTATMTHVNVTSTAVPRRFTLLLWLFAPPSLYSYVLWPCARARMHSFVYILIIIISLCLNSEFRNAKKHT